MEDAEFEEMSREDLIRRLGEAEELLRKEVEASADGFTVVRRHSLECSLCERRGWKKVSTVSGCWGLVPSWQDALIVVAQLDTAIAQLREQSEVEIHDFRHEIVPWNDSPSDINTRGREDGE